MLPERQVVVDVDHDRIRRFRLSQGLLRKHWSDLLSWIPNHRTVTSNVCRINGVTSVDSTQSGPAIGVYRPHARRIIVLQWIVRSRIRIDLHLLIVPRSYKLIRHCRETWVSFSFFLVEVVTPVPLKVVILRLVIRPQILHLAPIESLLQRLWYRRAIRVVSLSFRGRRSRNQANERLASDTLFK